MRTEGTAGQMGPGRKTPFGFGVNVLERKTPFGFGVNVLERRTPFGFGVNVLGGENPIWVWGECSERRKPHLGLG